MYTHVCTLIAKERWRSRGMQSYPFYGWLTWLYAQCGFSFPSRPPANSSHPRTRALLSGRPFSIDTGTDCPEGQMDDSPPVADQSAFPTNAPFSTWISPNNFGDFHPNPLMSLFTGNGQIEYPVEAVGAVSRVRLSKRQRAQFRAAIPIILLVMDLEIRIFALPQFQIRIRRRCR